MKSKIELFCVAMFSFVVGAIARDYMYCKEYMINHKEEKFFDDEDLDDYDDFNEI